MGELGLTLDNNGNRVSERCWSIDDGNGATGGGIADIYPVPDYQAKVSAKFQQKGRYVPDIAGNADPVTGYDVDVDEVPMSIGGTSAVAPLYAALCALITSRLGKPVNNWHEVLYNESVTVDVVGGNNGNYQCTEGFDLCTGLGWVDGEKLLIALARTNNLPVLPASPAKPKPTIPIPPVNLGFFANFLQAIKQFFGNL